MKALISVYDRAGVIEFAGILVEAGFEIISTGGTRGELSAAGLPVSLLSDVTGFPEVLDGRVKTLHPVIHAGILARRDLASHVAELSEHGIDGIDVVVGNLYPFVETVRKPDVTLEDALENIDIGGPTMIRAAAKNFPSVIVIVDPADYPWVGERIRALTNGGTIQGRADSGRAEGLGPEGLSARGAVRCGRLTIPERRRPPSRLRIRGRVREDRRPALRREPSSEGVCVPRPAGGRGDRERRAAARHRDVLHQLPRCRGGVVGRDRLFGRRQRVSSSTSIRADSPYTTTSLRRTKGRWRAIPCRHTEASSPITAHLPPRPQPRCAACCITSSSRPTMSRRRSISSRGGRRRAS